MVKYLCVAEKPSISKSITQILSGGQFRTVSALSRPRARATRMLIRRRHQRSAPAGPNFIKNYDFSYRMPPGPGYIDFTVTAVAGHLMSSDFGDLDPWQSCDPFQLFDARIYTYVNKVI